MDRLETPRIFCDFNGAIDDDTYALSCVGTKDDLKRLGLELRPGMRVVLYDYDVLASGEPAWLVADAVIVEIETWGLVARLDPKGFRWEPRSDEPSA
jgi:hypothetical protein